MTTSPIVSGLLRLPSGDPMPVLGQGTWFMGEDRARRDDEITALRVGLDLGMNLIDTAEGYGDGAAEELVCEAVDGQREQVFLVSKVLPQHASRRGTIAACEGSLRRLGTDRIDLYLLHWRGDVPLEETLEAFTALTRAGKIRHWGVSNFDVADMQELSAIRGGSHVVVDQVLYNPGRRGIEWDLLPWCRKHHITVMAYSPIEQGRLANDQRLRQIADRHGATPAQVALAWVLQQNVCVIPKAGTPAHVRENHAALELRLATTDLAELDEAFPAPREKKRLETL
jgi:diketogulonate reductase-like aldo/keto reductase